MLLDIFDENLHPLSVIAFLSSYVSRDGLVSSLLLLLGGSHLKTSFSPEIRSAT
jgi:hypothetical protein